MIKMTLFLTRRSDLTFSQFAEYWRTTHWGKIRNETRATELAAGYSQQHRVIGVPTGVSEAPYDGLVEAWFPDVETMHAMFGSPEWAAIMSDEANFLEQSKTLMLITEEKVRWGQDSDEFNR